VLEVWRRSLPPQNNNKDFRWLSGSRGGGNTNVVTRNIMGSAYEQAGASNYQWIVRSDPGTGILGKNPDPAKGHCVSDSSLIYLQNNAID